MKKTVIILITLFIMTTMLNGNLKSSSEPDSMSIKRSFGVHIFATTPPLYGQFDSTLYEKEILKAKELGAKYIRTIWPFSWFRVQHWNSTQLDSNPTLIDSFDYSIEDFIVSKASENGISVLPVIGFTAQFAYNYLYPDNYRHYSPPNPIYIQNYKNYIKKIVERYDGDGYNDAPIENMIPIKHWEFWNEPFAHYFQGTQDQYISLFYTTRDAMEEADSDAKIGAPCFNSGDYHWMYWDTTESVYKNIEYSSMSQMFDAIIKTESLPTSENKIYIDDIDFIVIHNYSLKDSVFMNDLRMIINKYPEKPIWVTEFGYNNTDPWKVTTYEYPNQKSGTYFCDSIGYCTTYNSTGNSEPEFWADSVSMLIPFNPDSNGLCINDSAYFYVYYKWPILAPDTFLRIGDTIRYLYNNDKDTVYLVYNGGPIIDNNGDTLVNTTDSIFIQHCLTRSWHPNSLYDQANHYRSILDSIGQFLRDNPGTDLKLFPFCIEARRGFQYHPPILSQMGSGYYRLVNHDSVGGLSIINADTQNLPAFDTIQKYYGLILDSIPPSLSDPNYKHPDIIGSLNWIASDNQGIYSQKLFINNDTIQLDTAVRSFSGTYNGWHTYKGLEVRDYAWNRASDSDSVRVALFNKNSSDFTINLYSQRDIGWKYNVYLNINFPPSSPNSRISVYFTIYYKKNNGQWKTAIAKRGYNPYLLDSTAYRDDDFTAFVTNYLYNGDSVFTDYSNVCSLSIGCINPLLLSKNTDGFIPEVELFTLENKQLEEYSYILKHCPNNNNVSFRIINGENYTYIDNIKLYAIDSKKNINLNDTKDEIDTTYIKSIRTELEQESLDSRLNSIDEKYYILKPNDTLDFTFRNINRELSKGYTRYYVMEITGYQGDVISAGIAKRKKELNNDVRMIRSVGSSLEIEFSSIRKREINLKVCDLSGRIVRNEKIMLDKGRKNYLIKSLPRGIYLIQANSKSFKGIILK